MEISKLKKMLSTRKVPSRSYSGLSSEAYLGEELSSCIASVQLDMGNDKEFKWRTVVRGCDESEVKLKTDRRYALWSASVLGISKFTKVGAEVDYSFNPKGNSEEEALQGTSQLHGDIKKRVPFGKRGETAQGQVEDE